MGKRRRNALQDGRRRFIKWGYLYCHRRISCAIGNGGIGYTSEEMAKKVNPIWAKGLLYVTGFKSVAEAKAAWSKIDIKEAPPLDLPLLIIHGGKC